MSPTVLGLWCRPLWAHALLLAVLLLGATPFLHLGDTFTSDEGAYALQVRALHRGGWEYDHGASRYDPEERWFPIDNATRGESGYYPYVKHPAFPLALLGATRLLGEGLGLHVLSLIGAIGVAAAAWLLAAEFGRGLSRPAFWLAAASPVFVNAYIVWAHAPSAAVSGFAVLCAIRTTRTSRGSCVVAMVSLVVLGVFLRAEGLLFAASLAVGLFAGLRGARWAVRLGVPVATCTAGLLAELVQRSWTTGITGSAPGALGFRGAGGGPLGTAAGWGDLARGRLEGAWHSLFQGAHDKELGTILVVAGLVLVGYAVFVACRRRPRWQRDVQVPLAGAVALYLLRAVLGPDESMTGLLAAWPAAALGVGLLLRRGEDAGEPAGRRSGVALLVVAGVTFGLAVVGTQYRFGGGFEWGGRFLFPLLVPLAVLACVGLHRFTSALGSARRVTVGLVTALAVLPVLTGLEVVRTTRPLLGDVVDEVAASGAELVVTESAALPRAAWRTYPRVAWMLVPAAEVPAVVARLRAAEARRVMLAVPIATAASVSRSVPGADDESGPGARRLGWRLLRLPDATA